MTISVGSKLPGGKVLRMGEAGAEAVELEAKLKGRKVVIFGLPGAFTGTCTTAHVPSFMRVMDKLKDKLKTAAITEIGYQGITINIGNVHVTSMARNGKPVNLKPYTRGDIASFRLAR